MAQISNNYSNYGNMESEEDDDDLQPAGLRAFHGSSVLESEYSGSSITSQSEATSLGRPPLQTKNIPIITGAPQLFDKVGNSSSGPDILEFFEFIAKNNVMIIPFEDLSLGEGSSVAKPSKLDDQLQGANMKIMKGQFTGHYIGRRIPGEAVAVALKVFKKATVPGMHSVAYDARKQISEYNSLMRDILHEIQIMYQGGANRHRNIAELIGVSFEVGESVTEHDRTGSNMVSRYLRPILVTPFAHPEYPDLRHYMAHSGRPRPLPWSICNKLICGIAEGIQGLHFAGVVHADLKPENILIFPESASRTYGEGILAKVSDFGFSGVRTTRANLEPRGGTRIWNAPECLASCTDKTLIEHSNKSTRDIYSFGMVMIYIMLDGGEPLPFGNLQELDTIKLQNSAIVESKERVRKFYAQYRTTAEPYELQRIEALVDCTMQLNPWDRRQTLKGVASDLAGSYIYEREIDMMRMMKGNNRFPSLASVKHSDPFHQAAASILPIVTAFRNLGNTLRENFLRHYLAQGIENMPLVQKLRFMGVCAQELRGNLLDRIPDVKNMSATERFKLVGLPMVGVGSSPSPKETKRPALETETLKVIEARLVNDFMEARNAEKILGRRFEKYQEINIGMLEPKQLQKTVDLSGLGNLHCAVLCNRLNDVLVLLQEMEGNCYLLDAVGDLGLTAVHIAALHGRISALRILLEHGCNPNVKSAGTLGYLTPLHLAIRWCPEEYAAKVIQLLLDRCAPEYILTPTGKSSNALHLAALRTQPHILQLILKVAPELLNRRDAYYRTPLHIAAMWCRLESVRLLLANGAYLKPLDVDGLTPLDLAKQCTETKLKEKRSDALYDFVMNGDFSITDPPELSNLQSVIAILNDAKGASSPDENAVYFQTTTQLSRYPNLEESLKESMVISEFPKQKGALTYYKAPKLLGLSSGPTFRAGCESIKSIPNEDKKIQILEVMWTDGKRKTLVENYLILQSRFGLRFIIHTIHDTPPAHYQVVIRLGRLKHKEQWNNFQLLLEVKMLPDKEVLVSQSFWTGLCLPLEDHIYTVKFTEFELLERTNIEISLSTVDISSKANPSSSFVLNWISVEPVVTKIPLYAILGATNVENQYHTPDSLTYFPRDYTSSDEVFSDIIA